MGEVEWTEQIMNILNERFRKSNSKFYAETQVKLPYGIMIKEFTVEEEAKKGKEAETKEHWKPVYNDEGSENTFATDLLIYEVKKGKKGENSKRIPRVVIEAKIKDASTHDVITYGKKATMHRALMPALRYGMMLGASKSEALTWKHFAHGSDFDFMFAFKEKDPNSEKGKDECAPFIKLVKSEIEISRKLEEMPGTKGEGSDICCVQKKLEIEENK